LKPLTLFAQQPSDRLTQIGENRLIERMTTWIQLVNLPAPRGIGDDAAVLPPTSGAHRLLTTDSLVFGRHFDETATAGEAGAKLFKRNASDIAAMGGTPKHSVVALVCGGDVSVSWLEEFYSGLAREASRYACEINGGDLTEGDPGTFTATLTLLGEAARPVARRGGANGSWIWVTGVLGGSILGHHLSFEPRLAEGSWLAGKGLAMAMMDTTDGLVRDLPKMVPEGLQARLDLALIPVADGARAAAQDSGKPAVWHSFMDGEDYELIFFTPPEINAADFEAEWQEKFTTPLAAIGTLRNAPPANGAPSGKVVGLDGSPIFGETGFEHFRTP